MLLYGQRERGRERERERGREKREREGEEREGGRREREGGRRERVCEMVRVYWFTQSTNRSSSAKTIEPLTLLQVAYVPTKALLTALEQGIIMHRVSHTRRI